MVSQSGRGAVAKVAQPCSRGHGFYSRAVDDFSRGTPDGISEVSGLLSEGDDIFAFNFSCPCTLVHFCCTFCLNTPKVHSSTCTNTSLLVPMLCLFDKRTRTTMAFNTTVTHLVQTESTCGSRSAQALYTRASHKETCPINHIPRYLTRCGMHSPP
jgi:hypothetical protein